MLSSSCWWWTTVWKPRDCVAYYYTSITRQWFSTWLCCSISLTQFLQSLSLKWTNNHMASFHHTSHRNIWLLHTSTELATVHAECMRNTLHSNQWLLTMWQMTIQFFGRLKYIDLEGQGHLTTWHANETPTVLVLHPMVTESGAVRFERNQS